MTFVVDLSEQRRNEETLRKMEEELRHAQKMEAIGRLAGGVAHDFNNILSVILCYGSLLATDTEDGPTRENADEICAAATRGAALTRQLLLFSRQEVTEERPLDVNGVVGGVERMLRRTLGEDIALETTLDTAIGTVLADPTHIEQVLMNLAVNARDAMPRGGRLVIETASVDGPPPCVGVSHGTSARRGVLISVSDTGCGMDAPTKARIFEPFFTTKERGKGTGLGLSTVFGIAEQSGGCVSVESNVGLGTTFRVFLPCIDRAVPSERAPVSRGSLRGGETILLVEDDEQVRRILLSILRGHGYQVLEASGPLDAVRMLDSAVAIDLLLTDVVMPHMSGPELARRVAAAHPATKILCMSGYTDDAVVRHGVIEGGFPLLQKPILPDVLAQRVRDILESTVAA
jgi:nitrogen-specific signal transduction histidine kinase